MRKKHLSIASLKKCRKLITNYCFAPAKGLEPLVTACREWLVFNTQ